MSDETRPAHPRGYPIYRPHWNERPIQLLNRSFEQDSELDWIRIAKHHDQVIAAYQIALIDTFNYWISALDVRKDYRGEGLGRWMLLHAIGLIESKGGRVVHVKCKNPKPNLEGLGFLATDSNEYRLQLVRE